MYGLVAAAGMLLVAGFAAQAEELSPAARNAVFSEMFEAGEVFACPSLEALQDILQHGFYEEPEQNICSLVSTDTIRSVPELILSPREYFFAEVAGGEELVGSQPIGVYQALVGKYMVALAWPFIIHPDFTEGEEPLIERGLLRGVEYVLWPGEIQVNPAPQIQQARLPPVELVYARY